MIIYDYIFSIFKYRKPTNQPVYFQVPFTLGGNPQGQVREAASDQQLQPDVITAACCIGACGSRWEEAEKTPEMSTLW